MKLGGTKTICAVFIAFLIVALGSTAQTQKQSDCGNAPGHGNPPWFDTGGKCLSKQRTYVYVNGNPTSSSDPTRDCHVYIKVCSLELNRRFRAKECPESKDFAQPTFCCDEFDKAVKSKQPCDPMQDADCDGIPNDKDDNPLKPDPKSPPKPVTKNMVDQAIRKEFQDHNLKLPSYYNPDLIRQNPNGWGFAIPMDDNGMPIVIIGSVQEAPDGSMSVTIMIWRHVIDKATGQGHVVTFPGGNPPESSGSGGCGQDGMNQALGKALDQANLIQYKAGT